MSKRWIKTKIAAASIAGLLALGTGLALAGELPGSAQDVASNALAKVGITVGGGTNHGHCVSWARHQAKEDGIAGRDAGRLASILAKDEDAVSEKVTEGGEPSGACQSAYDAAVLTLTSSDESEEGTGKPESPGQSEEHKPDSPGQSEDHKPESPEDTEDHKPESPGLSEEHKPDGPGQSENHTGS